MDNPDLLTDRVIRHYTDYSRTFKTPAFEDVRKVYRNAGMWYRDMLGDDYDPKGFMTKIQYQELLTLAYLRIRILEEHP